jgi:hypothetical protein
VALAFEDRKKCGRNICLADLSEEAKTRLTVTKLMNVFKINKSVDEALED